MKSSPFKLFSLSAREADQRGNYANPELGRYKATTFDHPDLSGIKNSKPKAEKEDSNTSSYKIPIKEFKTNFPETPDMPNLMGNNNNNNNGRGSRNASGSTTTTTGGKSYRQAYAEAGKPGETYKQYVERADQWHKDNPGNRPSSSTTTSSWNTTEDFNLSTGRSTAMNMKGSPVKHNAGAVGSIENADPLAGGIAGIGQQMGNQAQQRAAKLYTSRASNGPTAEAAGGMIGVTGSIGQDVLPPPNQVAETGSYGSGGDRDMLEMNGNQINNQSIGRNTDITSQLFGSGQRASMLAMKGTPLHHDSEKQAHTHPSKTTTKMKPDGEYPGARYVKGDLVDQDDLLEKTELDAHIATQVQSDKKGTFIKEKSDDGPGSDIETSKGFGKKIRLGSMGRSSYTSNMKDQLDPNDFLFKNTPKK